MTDPIEPFDPPDAADAMVARLKAAGDDETVNEAVALLDRLRAVRAFVQVEQLAEQIRRRNPGHVRARRLYGQALIESGRPTVAIDVLRVMRDDLPPGHPERAKAAGLIGRAFKEMFFDAGDDAALAGWALDHALTAYRIAYEHDPVANAWQGVNLLGLSAKAQEIGRSAPVDPAAIARDILAHVDALPEEQRSPWQSASAATAALALGDWQAAQERFKVFLTDQGASAFQIGSTLRELLRTWNIEGRSGGRDLVAALNVRMAQEPDGAADLSVDEVRAETARLNAADDKDKAGRFEAVLGKDAGFQSYRWWKNGMERAQAVASVRDSVTGQRVGTAFLTTAAAFGLETPDDQLIVTNYHVVNAAGEFVDRNTRQRALKPDEAEVVFEAVDSTPYQVAEILWSSDNQRHDVTLLRLAERVPNVRPLRTNTQLPLRAEELGDGTVPRVYVIGYPGGRDLAFSFQDNELLDHEGPTSGRPQIEGVCRVHYRAPTEGGSSGSPVFNYGSWEVIAVHHKGGRSGMPKLNGVVGEYGANEAISVACIADAIRADAIRKEAAAGGMAARG